MKTIGQKFANLASALLIILFIGGWVAILSNKKPKERYFLISVTYNFENGNKNGWGNAYYTSCATAYPNKKDIEKHYIDYPDSLHYKNVVVNTIQEFNSKEDFLQFNGWEEKYLDSLKNK